MNVSIVVHWCSSHAISPSLEEVYSTSLKHFLRTVYKHPKISFALYCSGHIFQWLSHTHKEVIDVINELIGNNRMEILGGAFYEPFFSLVPKMDYSGQIEMYSNMVRHLFGKRPHGAWLPQSLWDPALVPILAKGGMRYTFLPCQEFSQHGSVDPFAAHITEYDGKSIVLFPVQHVSAREFFSKDLSSLLRPSSTDVHEARHLVVSLSAIQLASMQESEITQWMTSIEPHDQSIRFCIPRSMYPRISKVQPINIPESSYGTLVPLQCAEWKGRSIRSCLDQYIEARMLYAKMRYLHILLRQFRGDKMRKLTARTLIWKSQAHYAFWNGCDEGIRSSHLRHAHYQSLLEAEKTLRARGIFLPSLLHLDYDFDGLGELLYTGYEMNVYIHRMGAAIFEMDWMRRLWNYGNTYTPTEGIVGQSLVVHYGRSFIDHFFPEREKSDEIDPELELGSFFKGLYQLTSMDKKKNVAIFVGEGRVGDATVSIEKKFTFLRHAVSVEYRIKSVEEAVSRVFFSPEISLSFSDAHTVSLKRSEKNATLPVTLPSTQELCLEDTKHRGLISLSFSHPARCWCRHKFTSIDQKEKEIEEYQYTTVLPCWKLNLKQGEEVSFKIVFKIDTY